MATQKPKIDRTKYIFQDKKDENLIKKTGEVDGYNFNIRNCHNCEIHILDWTKGVNLIIKIFLKFSKDVY
jgi:hypothetical protein